MWYWSRIYTYRISLETNRVRDKLYTYWIRNFIGEVGKDSFFHYPLRLQGGGNRRISIGFNTSIHAYSIIGCWKQYGNNDCYEPEICIGDNCIIGEYCHITAVNRIKIGNGLLTGRFVYIGDNAHGGLSWEEASIPPVSRKLNSKGEIIIGSNVWIGDKVTILGGVKIGDNVIIGANSVVTKDIPSNTMVAGVPARIIKSLN
jgi:acetyltransferase-like isoleucine patch superfamily enzyme